MAELERPRNMTGAQTRKAWLYAIFPVAFTLASIFYTPTLPSMDFVSLPTVWRRAEGVRPEWRSPDLVDEGWAQVQLPLVEKRWVFPYPAQLSTFRGRFDLNPGSPSQELYLICDCTGTIVVNGQDIGAWDPYRGGPRLGVAHGSQAGFPVPAELLRPTGNVLVLEMDRPPHNLTLGPKETLHPYFTRLVDLKRAITLGPNFVMAVLALIFWRLSTLSDDAKMKRLYRSAVLLAVGSAVLADLKLGLVQSMPEIDGWTMRYHLALTCLAGLYYYEFFEEYFFQRILPIRYINRVICIVCALACLRWHVFNLWSQYVQGLMAWGVFMCVTSRRLRADLFGPTLSVTFICWLGGNLHFLLSPGADARMVLSPDVMLGLIVSGVLLADFLNVYARSRKLTASLGQTNTELAHALAQATEASRLKGEFVANVSHELRTPLNAIINVPAGILGMFQSVPFASCRQCREQFALEPGETISPTTECPSCQAAGLEQGERTILAGKAEEVTRHLELIQRSGNHLLNVVNDILDFSKLDAGKMNMVLESVQVSELLNGVVETLKPLADAKRIELQTLGTEDAIEIRADRVKCVQVLINLVGNAIKFSEEGSRVVLSHTREGDYVRLAVQDHGIGLSEEQTAYIFEPFRQADGGHTRRFGGTGLGLSIAKQIVELHEGRISVQSKLGEGSTFFVDLPLLYHEPAGQKVDAAGGTPQPETTHRVVVGEDDPVAMETIRLALRAVGIEVIAVRDARKLVSVITAEQPAAVILDVMMPRLSGLEVLKELRALAKFRKLPVVVSTGYLENEDLARALGAAWLPKPWKKERLTELVLELVGDARVPLDRAASG